jgi:hypothetical protein|tara:strand:- start:365 stop:493 length:129 start_codon:yes stop_codon:yes gene_type:complete
MARLPVGLTALANGGNEKVPGFVLDTAGRSDYIARLTFQSDH